MGKIYNIEYEKARGRGASHEKAKAYAKSIQSKLRKPKYKK